MSAKDFMKLVRDGKIAEARAMLEAERVKAEFSPTEISQQTGRPAVCKRHGKVVVPDKNGNWKLKEPPGRKRKGRS